MCNIAEKFINCGYRNGDSFSLSYSSMDGKGSAANVQWISIGYIFSNDLVFQWQAINGTTAVTVTYTITLSSFALPFRCTFGTTFADDGNGASRGHVATNTAIYEVTLSSCKVYNTAFNKRKGSYLLIIGT